MHIFSCLFFDFILFVLDLQQKLAQMLSRLMKIAEEYSVAVYVTNQGNLSASFENQHYAF